MNSKKRITYQQRQIQRRKKLESKFMRPVYDVTRSFFFSAASTLRDRGIDATRMILRKQAVDAKLGEVIRRLYITVWLKYATWTYNEIQRSAYNPNAKSKHRIITMQAKLLGSQVNFNEQWTNDIMQYFRMFLIDKAVLPITIKNRDRIMSILDRGTAEGWSIERMAKEIETDEFQLWHTRLVVRTETAKAAYYGRRVGAVDSGYETEKEWISARDSRTRHAHMDMDGETIDFNNKYNVPLYKKGAIVGHELMRGPGDPEASAENVCNCRCTESYKAKRDANGRLMRKPQSRVSVIQPGTFNRPTLTVTI